MAGLRYPKELLEIQVLDDSTDETSSIAREHIRNPEGERLTISAICIAKIVTGLRQVRFRPDWKGQKESSLPFSMRTLCPEMIFS